jgi:glycosyltransferase involved in cell wall biosynthesis
VVREAAAFEVPSVVIEGSAAAQQIVDGNNGFATENSVQAYAGKLALLLEDEQLLRRNGEGARRSLCMSWKDAVRDVKERYLSLLGRSSAAAVGGSTDQYSVDKEMVR